MAKDCALHPILKQGFHQSRYYYSWDTVKYQVNILSMPFANKIVICRPWFLDDDINDDSILAQVFFQDRPQIAYLADEELLHIFYRDKVIGLSAADGVICLLASSIAITLFSIMSHKSFEFVVRSGLP